MTTLVLGVDLGTSGARAVAMTPAFEIVSQGAAPLSDFGSDHRDPQAWWHAVERAIQQCLSHVDASRVSAIAVDATSGTVLATDRDGAPLARPLMYNDPVADLSIVESVDAAAPNHSAALGANSGLARMLLLQKTSGVAHLLHQADWIAGRLKGRFGVTDENNALKSGYDPIRQAWPEWLDETPIRRALLPEVVPPGTAIGTISAEAAGTFGLRSDVKIVAGTTDGCASFLATGANATGDAVTVLGSTMTLKLLCDEPIFSPGFGIYSHRIGDKWLAGGASNSGGKVLSHFFDVTTLQSLSANIDPETESGLDYYPLLAPGERFPVADPAYPPRLSPRPASDAAFLKGMLEGLASIEAQGYRRLGTLGAPILRSVRTTGGGAANPVWRRMREQRLGVPLLPSYSEEAAAGAARLALTGL